MKRIVSLLLAVVMILSLCTVAFATDSTEETPESPTYIPVPKHSRVVSEHPGIASFTIGGNPAVFHQDPTPGQEMKTDDDVITYADQIYIRGLVDETEAGMKSVAVSITLDSTSATVTGDIPFSGTGTTKTATIDLLNKAYSINVTSNNVTTNYIVAASMPKGDVDIADNDPLRITSITINGATGVPAATNVRNPYMGNMTLCEEGKWTYITYKVDATMSSAPANRAAVPATISLPDGTTAPTSNSCLNADGTLKLDGALSKLRIRNGTTDRFYYIFATDSTRFNVTFGIDFTEAKASTEYENDSDVRDAVDLLESYAIDYFGGDSSLSYGTISVDSGDTVMDIMRDFAVANDLGDEVPEGCTYMATLNGIGEFTFGQMSGWMYTNTPYRDNAGNALFTSWFTPPIGAADYTLSEGDNICWFICTNYVHHPWQ